MTANYLTGRELVLGVKKATTWRTAETMGALDGVLVTEENFGAKEPTYLPDDSLGQDDIMDMIKTNELIDGAGMKGYLRYEGWDTLLALCLGVAGTPSNEEGTAYSNTYSIKSNLGDLFATIAARKASTSHGIWEIPSAKISGLVIEGEIGKLTTISFDIMGNKIETVSTINDTTSMDAITYPDSHHIVKMDSDFKIRMNAQAGGALSDSDKIYPHGYTLTYKRPMDIEAFEASYDDLGEPCQDGFAEATLQLRFDKYNLDTFMDAVEGSTEYKMDITNIGDLISGTTYYQFRIDIPKLMLLKGDAPVTGPGKIPQTVDARLLGTAAAPTGMSGVTTPISIYVVNTRTTDPLA